MTTRLHVLPSSYCSTASVPQQKNRTDSMMTLPAPSPFSPLFFLCAFFAYPQVARPRRVCVRAWGLAHVLAKAGSPSLSFPRWGFCQEYLSSARSQGREGRRIRIRSLTQCKQEFSVGVCGKSSTHSGVSVALPLLQASTLSSLTLARDADDGRRRRRTEAGGGQAAGEEKRDEGEK